MKKRWGLLVVLIALLCFIPVVTRSRSTPIAGPEVVQESSAGVPTENANIQERLPEIPIDKMTEAQKKAAQEFQAGRGTPVFGPFVPLLRSPDVMLRAMQMGDYLRFKTVLPPKLRELAIIYTSRLWTQQYEWDVHSATALKVGLSPEIIKAVAEGRRPTGMSEEEEAVYDFCVELHHNQSVSDATYARMLARFGEQGVIDLTSLNGFYTFQAMVLNVARTATPKGSVPRLKPFPR